MISQSYEENGKVTISWMQEKMDATFENVVRVMAEDGLTGVWWDFMDFGAFLAECDVTPDKADNTYNVISATAVHTQRWLKELSQ